MGRTLKSTYAGIKLFVLGGCGSLFTRRQLLLFEQKHICWRVVISSVTARSINSWEWRTSIHMKDEFEQMTWLEACQASRSLTLQNAMSSSTISVEHYLKDGLGNSTPLMCD